jgi:hypothetical protein
MFANLSKTRPNYDAKIEDKVHMTTEIVHVLWRCDHVFTSGVNAYEARMMPDLARIPTL